ncbi:MAG: molybdopterin-dependent oxidoreductase [Acidobacteriota bacterium]|jgi:anaerobic selenocysteine-containing dehydrogenase|nr:molybdopterin-dependent oxidoreductase [Acidobacteriota bacterium]
MQTTDMKPTRRTILKAAGAIGIGAAVWDAAPSLVKVYAAENGAATVDEKVVPTMCAMCGPSQGCGIGAVVRNGRFVGIEPLKEAPLNHGKNCGKAHAAPQWVYSPQRLRYPMKRVGQKGEGKFQRISWDEAITAIATKLKEQKKKFGPESLAVLSPARRIYSEYLYRFLTVHGSPNYGHSGICAMQKAFAFQYTLAGSPNPDTANAKLRIIWAKQPVYAGSAKGGVKQLLDDKGKGVKIIAIKPTMEPDVALANIWVPIRPGTDAALALAFLNVVIAEKLYDAAFVEKWTYGFDKLVPHIRKYTPEWAEKVSGVKAAQIREVARLYATTKEACIETGNGFEHAPSCSDAIRAISILIAITGHLDRKGGNLLGGGGPAGVSTRAKTGAKPKVAPESLTLGERYTQDMVDKMVGPEFPPVFQPFMEGTSSAYYRIFESVLTGKPYSVRTIIAPGTQPTVSTRGTKNVVEALKKVDFYVVLDITRTADMNYADIVIPISTMYEVDGQFEGGGNWIMPRRQVIKPLGESKTDYEFWIDLGTKMGYGKDFWNGSVDEWMKYRLNRAGVTLEQLRAKPEGIVREARRPTPVYEKYEQAFAARSQVLSRAPFLPQKKVAIYNTSFEAAGFNPLPEWREPPESPTGTPELLKKYPLTFSDFHTSKVYNAGWLRNVPYLREVLSDPSLQMHPETAKSRGIKNGDWVVVESPHNRIRLKADVNPGIRRDTVMALHGWWQDCEELGKPEYPLVRDGANTNSMYDVSEKAYDPLVTAMTSQTLVEVRKA